MRIIILFVLALPGYAFAQECNVKKTTDPYTKQMKLSSGLISLSGASLAIDANKQEIDFFFSMEGKEKCFSGGSTAVVFFEGTRVKANFKNGGTTNCDGIFHFIFRNSTTTNTMLRRLLTQKITSIVFTGNNKSETTITLSPEEQGKIMSLGDCLVNEAKKLLE